MLASLLTEPTAGVLDQLFADAQRTRAAFRERGRQRLPGGGPGRDERAFFAAARDVHLAVSRRTGTLLYLLARTHRARGIVEFGTSFGVSTICLAAAVRDNGGGTVIGTEFEADKVEGARASLAAAGLADLVQIREGDALLTLRHDLPDPVDLVFLDGAKSMYRPVLELLEPRLAPGAVVVADNASRGVGYLEYIRSGEHYLSTGFEDEDVEISIRNPGRPVRTGG